MEQIKKYIRTKDGKILPTLWQDTSRAIKQADTIPELCNEFIVYAEDYGYFNPTEIIHRHWVFDDIEEAKEQIKLIGAGIERIVYGAIWIKGEHDEPILKSVAKMKGILPNGEIDWELL